MTALGGKFDFPFPLWRIIPITALGGIFDFPFPLLKFLTRPRMEIPITALGGKLIFPCSPFPRNWLWHMIFRFAYSNYGR